MTIRTFGFALAVAALLGLAACNDKKTELDGAPKTPTATPSEGPVPPLNVPSASPSATATPN